MTNVASFEEVAAEEAATGAAAGESKRRRRWPLPAYFAAGWLALIAIAAVLAPVLPIANPSTNNINIIDKGPFHGSFLGGDTNGLDVFSRCIWGARTSLLIGFGAVLIGLLVGGSLGLITGYYRNWASTLLSSLFDILLAFPQLVLALALVSVFAPPPSTTGRREALLIVSLGIVSIPILARITRANALSWAQREFVMAAKSQGAKNSRVIFREVLPNVVPAMLSISLLGVAVAIVAEAGLSVIGAGMPPNSQSWGTVILSSRGDIATVPHAIFAPCAFIFLTVLALNYLGDVVRDRFDVRESVI